MSRQSPSLRRKTARRATAPAKNDEEKKARKPAYLTRKMAVSQPQDKEEQEADQVAKEVSRAPREETPGPQEDKRMISAKPVPSARRLMRRLNRAAAKPDEQKPAGVQRSVETEDPEEQPTAPLRTKLRRKENAKQPEEQKPAARAMREKKAATPV